MGVPGQHGLEQAAAVSGGQFRDEGFEAGEGGSADGLGDEAVDDETVMGDELGELDGFEAAGEGVGGVAVEFVEGGGKDQEQAGLFEGAEFSGVGLEVGFGWNPRDGTFLGESSADLGEGGLVLFQVGTDFIGVGLFERQGLARHGLAGLKEVEVAVGGREGSWGRRWRGAEEEGEEGGEAQADGGGQEFEEGFHGMGVGVGGSKRLGMGC